MGQIRQLSVLVLAEKASIQQVVEDAMGLAPFSTPIRDQIASLLLPDFSQLNLEPKFMADHEGNSVSTLSVTVDEFEPVERRITELLAGFAFKFERAEFEAGDEDAPLKSIEIYYDIADIPAGYDHYLDFRNDAMDLIETALAEANAGEWSGAESGMGEVNFGFEVEDFDCAERIVRATVKGTPFEGIREITRYDSAAGTDGPLN